MRPHALTEYLKYLWQAKKLHGVHSPFVYAFSEQVLYAVNAPAADIKIQPGLFHKRYSRLPGIIKQHFNYNKLLLLSAATDIHVGKHDMVIVTEENPGNWVQVFNKYYHCLDSDTVMIVPKIHATKRHSVKWRRLHTHPKILLSIDVYGMGIIFFRKEFKEKQHFVLKY